MATMRYCNWPPSSMAPELGEYHVYENDIEGVNLEEGFRDSDDVTGNLTAVSGELNRVTVLSSQDASGNASVKRKGPMSIGNTLKVKKIGAIKKKKKAKGPVSNVIAEYLTDLVGMQRSAIEHANEEV